MITPRVHDPKNKECLLNQFRTGPGKAIDNIDPCICPLQEAKEEGRREKCEAHELMEEGYKEAITATRLAVIDEVEGKLSNCFSAPDGFFPHIKPTIEQAESAMRRLLLSLKTNSK